MPNKLVVLFAGNVPSPENPATALFRAMPNIALLSARSVGDAAIWIDASWRIDLLIVDVRLSGGVIGMEIARLAAFTHPNIAIVAILVDARPELSGWPNRCAFVRGPCADDTLAMAVDEAFINLGCAVA